MNEKSNLQTDQMLLGATAGYMGLRKFVLEWYSQMTSEPMNQAEQRLRGYIDAELERLLRELAESGSPDYARILDFRKKQSP
jgi:hypothetical protein